MAGVMAPWESSAFREWGYISGVKKPHSNSSMTLNLCTLLFVAKLPYYSHLAWSGLFLVYFQTHTRCAKSGSRESDFASTEKGHARENGGESTEDSAS